MKKITIPQSTYGKTAKYISSSTLRFTVTMDEQTYLTLLRLAESGNTSRNLYLAALVNQAERSVSPPPVVLP
jgi:hypothetical protein